MEVIFPALSKMGSQIKLNYLIKNNSGNSLDVLYSISDSSDFFVSGYTRQTIRIQEENTTSIVIEAVPLRPGHRRLPNMKITSPSGERVYIDQKASYSIKVDC